MKLFCTLRNFKRTGLLFFLLVGIYTNSKAQALELVKDLTAYDYNLSAYNYKTLINASGETYIYSQVNNGNCAATYANGFYISKLDVNKNCVWFVNVSISGGVSPGYSHYFNDMILDNAGNVILNGYVYNYGATGNIYTVTCGSVGVTFPVCNTNAAHLNYLFKITSAGAVSWGKTYYETAGTFGSTGLTSMTSDASNNIYLTGEMDDLVYDGVKRSVTNNGHVILLKISAAGAYTSLVAQSVSAGGGYMSGPKIIFNPTSGRLFFVSQLSTQGSASGGVAFSNGATIAPDPVNPYFGLYFASLNTAMNVQSQIYYKTLDWAFINNYNSDMVNSGDSIIYSNVLSEGTGSLVFGANTITKDANYRTIMLLKLSASTPSTVAWAKQFTSGYFNTKAELERGQGDNVYLLGYSYRNIDFGNSVLLNFSAANTTSYLYQFKASTGASDWAIKIPQINNYDDQIGINYSATNSSLFLHISSSNIDGVAYDFSIYKINTKLKITSLTAAATLCPGSTISAAFSLSQTPMAGNVYTLQLSNEEGHFSSFVNIGTLTSTALSGTITGTMPAGLEGSPYMKVRVVASNPSIVGAESAAYINLAVPNNTREINNLNPSSASNVCEQLNITITPSILYGTTFKWQINTGFGFTDMVNNAFYSGVTTGSLTITAAPMSFNGYQYKLLVTNSTCPSVTVAETVTLTVKPRPTVVSVVPVTRCDAGTVSLSATPSTGAFIRWYNAATGGSLLSAVNPYTPSISATTTYYADAYLNGCYAFSRVSLLATVNTTPTISSAPAITMCGPTTVTAVATPSAGGVVNWYSALTGGTSLYTGTNYATPVLSANTTYYADASQNGCTSTRTAVPITIYITPSVNSTTNGARCDNGVVNVVASASAGNVLWYTASTGGTPVFTGTNYSPSLTATTNYYVAAATPNCTTAVRTLVTAMVTSTPTISTPVNGQHCNAGPVTISALPSAGSVNWYTVSTGGSIITNTPSSYTTPSIASTTTYYAEAVNNSCISASRIAVVASIFPTPTFSLSKTDPSACGTATGTITVSGLSAFAFYGVDYNGGSSTTLPTNGSGVITMSSLSAGAYANFTVTTANSCSTINAAGVSLTDPSAPTISATSASRCDPGSVVLSASSSATVYWYTQSTGGTFFTSGPSYSPSLLTTTTYYVEAATGGCSSGRIPVTATIYPTPTVTSTTPDSKCGTSTITVGINYSSGTVSWYANSSGGSTIGSGSSLTIPSLSTTTTYYAEAINGVCPPTSRQPVTATILPIPSVVSTTPGSNCGPGTVNLSATPSTSATIQWYTVPSGGAVFSTSASTTTNYLISTATYYAEAVQGICTSPSRTPVTATIHGFPGFTVSKTDPSACQVADGSFTLSGLTPGASYNLQYNAVAPQAIVASGTGTYTKPTLLAGTYNGIIVTDVNTCSSVAGSTTLTEPGGPSIDAGIAQTVCQGDLVTLTADNPDNADLTWSTGAITASISFTASGDATTYYVITADLLGCLSKDSVAVKVRSDQTIIDFPAIADQTVFSLPFNISATTSSALPVTFTSLDISVATVSGNQITIVGPGTAIIQASQPGSICFNPSADSIQSFEVTGKLNQVITFGSLPDITFGDLPFDLGALVNSTNPIVYEVSDPSIVSIVNGNAIGLKAGTVIVKAYAMGSTNYNPSDTALQILRVIVPTFKIFGSTTVQGENNENYFVSPNSTKYSYTWNYKGSNTYFISDTVSRDVSLYFKTGAVGDTLRCRVYSIASNTYLEVYLFIKVFPGDEYLPPVNCDSLKSTLTICSGKFINGFTIEELVNLNSDCDQGYSDNTRLDGSYTTELSLGEAYNAEVQIGNKSNVNLSANYIGLWLDYNNNGSFDDPNEFLISTYSADSSFWLKNILLSTNETLGGKNQTS